MENIDNAGALALAANVPTNALVLPSGTGPVVFDTLQHAIAAVKSIIANRDTTSAIRETRVYSGVAASIAAEYSASSIIVGLEEFQFDQMVTATVNAMTCADTKNPLRKSVQTQVSRAIRTLRDSDAGDIYVWPPSKDKKIVAPAAKLIRAWIDAASSERVTALLDLIPAAIELADNRAADSLAARDAARDAVLANMSDADRMTLGFY